MPKRITPLSDIQVKSAKQKDIDYKIADGGKGDHQKYKHPSKAGHVVVPHPRKDVAIGTLRNIYRQAGWEWR